LNIDDRADRPLRDLARSRDGFGLSEALGDKSRARFFQVLNRIISHVVSPAFFSLVATTCVA
jgi:hypothetical protein